MPDPDAYFQRNLYMGAFVTVPFPGNDHTITPDAAIEKYYLDYGMLLNALKGREWLVGNSPTIADIGCWGRMVFMAEGGMASTEAMAQRPKSAASQNTAVRP